MYAAEGIEIDEVSLRQPYHPNPIYPTPTLTLTLT